ncbi:MAG TPA: hypothetical protein VGR28_14610 [Candidatus Thermoplasmatota archaeon]|jgi:hypothetical protein|nr:hypothetical protein [Candidatus Thermoplasmatota archaeon]
MDAVPLAALAGERVLGWRVLDGALWLRTPRGEVPCVCDCGRVHLLPDEDADAQQLHLRCHGCGRVARLAMA